MRQWYPLRSLAGLLVLIVCMLLPVIAGCGSARAGQPGVSPEAGSWTLYRDAHYDFTVPVPVGWQVWQPPDDGCMSPGNCNYQVDFYPPDGQGRLPVSEQIYIGVNIGSGKWQPPQAPDYTRAASDVTVGTATVPLYANDAGDWIRHAAVVDAGARQYILGVQAPDARAARDEAVYARMLQGFTMGAATP